MYEQSTSPRVAASSLASTLVTLPGVNLHAICGLKEAGLNAEGLGEIAVFGLDLVEMLEKLADPHPVERFIRFDVGNAEHFAVGGQIVRVDEEPRRPEPLADPGRSGEHVAD